MPYLTKYVFWRKDGDKACIVTKIPLAKPAFIFPYVSGQRKELRSLESILSVFWEEDKYRDWMRLIQDLEVIGSTRNLIYLERQMHWLFDTARFALKPLRYTEDSVTIQFHWLKDANLRPKTPLSPGNALVEAGLMDQHWGPQRGIRRDDGWPVETGQTYVIQSSDAKTSFQLLQLHWDFIRIGVICGAAEASDADYKDDDDDDDDDDEEGITRYSDEHLV